MNTSQKIHEKYDGFFEKIFKELEEEIKTLRIKVSNPLVFEIKSINGCVKPNDFSIKLLILRSSALLNLNRLLKEIPQEERINFLRIINLKLEDLKSFNVKKFKLEYEQRQGAEEIDLSIYPDNTINRIDLIDILDRINKYEKIWSNAIEEERAEIEKMILKVKAEAISIIPEYAEKPKPLISWEGTDTDLLELVTALVKSGKINNQTKNLKRSDAVTFFEKTFNLKIKNAESLLARATNRKNEQAPFLESLKQAFINYCRKKEEKDLPIK